MKIERIVFGAIIALSMGVYAYAESYSTAGATQYKYTASGYSYSTSTRTCCSNKTWSDWDKECCTGAGCCTSGTCWNGSTCEAQISSKCGDQANLVYSNCVQGKGYLYYCVCKSDASTKQVYKNDSFRCPDLSCNSGTVSYDVKRMTISLNDKFLCNGWYSTYNSICANAVSSWFNSATKCYSGYKKAERGIIALAHIRQERWIHLIAMTSIINLISSVHMDVAVSVLTSCVRLLEPHQLE